jgi:hypothetical protein
VSSTARQPAEAVSDLRAEWRQAKSDPTTTPQDLHTIEVLGRAAALVDQELGG